MRRSIEWTEKKTATSPEVSYRVSLFAGAVRWQRKEKNAEIWETPKFLTEAAWERLIDEVERRYARRSARHEDVVLIRATAEAAPKLP